MNTETQYAKRKWAEKLGVSTSGYHKWRYVRHRRQAIDDTRHKEIKAVFSEGQDAYGIDRICGILRRDGSPASYPVVKRIIYAIIYLKTRCFAAVITPDILDLPCRLQNGVKYSELIKITNSLGTHMYHTHFNAPIQQMMGRGVHYPEPPPEQ